MIKVKVELHHEKEELRTLKEVLNRHPKPYMRERASALLQIHDGKSGLQVARHGLLKSRKPDTIYKWVHAYNDLGLSGLYIKPGRGRKRVYDQSKEAEIKTQIHLLVLHEQNPANYHR